MSVRKDSGLAKIAALCTIAGLLFIIRPDLLNRLKPEGVAARTGEAPKDPEKQGLPSRIPVPVIDQTHPIPEDTADAVATTPVMITSNTPNSVIVRLTSAANSYEVFEVSIRGDRCELDVEAIIQTKIPSDTVANFADGFFIDILDPDGKRYARRHFDAAQVGRLDSLSIYVEERKPVLRNAPGTSVLIAERITKGWDIRFGG